jgi:hypothetical protein
MGDRISISFVRYDVNGHKEESVTLFSHWQGTNLLSLVDDYLKDYRELRDNAEGLSIHNHPLFRFDPGTVMMDFVSWLSIKLKDDGEDRHVFSHDFYLAKDQSSGDNSDNGHFEIDENFTIDTDN